jgi:hypothetical protein
MFTRRLSHTANTSKFPVKGIVSHFLHNLNKTIPNFNPQKNYGFLTVHSLMSNIGVVLRPDLKKCNIQ